MNRGDGLPYRIGLLAWRYGGWEGHYFEGPDRLAQYAEVFNTVEGNTTFYATPSESTVQHWHEQVEGRDFRFCFKLPREVTHQSGGRRILLEFLRAIEPLSDYLGPFLVQLPATVGPDDRQFVLRLLAALPDTSSAALEVRHPDFYSTSDTFDRYFAESGCLRVVMDARPIHGEGPEAARHPEVLAARHEKPDLPVFHQPTNNGVLVRLILHPDEAINQRYYDEWSERVATWLKDDVDVSMMIHNPNNLHCPAQARIFHQWLVLNVDNEMMDLPDWPLRQASLF